MKENIIAKLIVENDNYGFLIYEILEPKDIQTRIIGKRGMKAFEHINYVQAVIKKNG